MALYLLHLSEPCANDGHDKYAWVDSAAYRQLRREISRYVKKEIRGRSFLVAGHRGSGKTSTVLRAFEAAKLSDNGEVNFPRPLLVQLHGLHLLGGSVSDEPSAAESQRLALHARAEIALALHRALCLEFARCYRKC